MKIVFLMLFAFATAAGSAQTTFTYQVDHYKWHITALNFHKPRTDCKSGFGFCFKAHTDIQGHWELNRTIPQSSVSGDDVTIYLIKNDKTISLHITKAIQQLKEFSKTVFTEFELEDGYQFSFNDGSRTIKLKPGVYTVQQNKTEFVIDIPLLQ